MKISSPLAAVLMLASLVGFQAQAGSETRQVTDADGKTQVVPAQPKRVVVLSEIDLDSALTLGLQPVGTVNGRGQSTLPRYLLQQAGKEIAVVGDLDNPNLEKLIDLEPDLILTGQTKPELLALLKEIAPTVVTGNWGDSWKEIFNRSAHVLNRDAEAKTFLAQYDARLQQARSKLAKHQGERLSIVRWNPKGPSYMHGGTFASSVVEEMGLTRPTHQIGDKTPPLPGPEPRIPQFAGRRLAGDRHPERQRRRGGCHEAGRADPGLPAARRHQEQALRRRGRLPVDLHRRPPGGPQGDRRRRAAAGQTRCCPHHPVSPRDQRPQRSPHMRASFLSMAFDVQLIPARAAPFCPVCRCRFWAGHPAG